MSKTLEGFDDERRWISQLQGELDRLRSRLALEIGSSTLPGEAFDAMLFRVGEARLAIPLAGVEEVVMVAATAAIPDAPPWISGLLDLRGEALVVLDVGARIQRGQREPELNDLIVIARVEDRRVGLVVQEIVDIVSVDREEIASAMTEPEEAPYVLGVFLHEDVQTQLLGLQPLLALSDLPGPDS